MSTQTQHPWRTALRTAFQALIALAIVVPLVLAELGYTDLIVAGVSVVAVCAAVTRVMAIPQVVTLLERFVPWLAPEPRRHRDLTSSKGAGGIRIESAYALWLERDEVDPGDVFDED